VGGVVGKQQLEAARIIMITKAELRLFPNIVLHYPVICGGRSKGLNVAGRQLWRPPLMEVADNVLKIGLCPIYKCSIWANRKREQR